MSLQTNARVTTYHLKEMSFLLCPCIAEDIGRNEKYKAKRELLVLQQSDSHK